MRVGFVDRRADFAFEADTCSRSVTLKLEEKGLVKRGGHKRVTLAHTDTGREVVAAMRTA